MFPCSPPFIGSFLESCCCRVHGDASSLGTVKKLTLASVDFLLSLYLTIPGGFYISIVLFSGTACLWSYIKTVRRSRVFALDLHTYKKLQMLETLYTSSNAKRNLPTFLTGVPGIQIFSAFVCIRLQREVDMPQFSLFPLLYLDGILLTIVYLSLASSVYVSSNGLIERWKKHRKCRRSKYIRKTLRSLRPLKIKFRNNFVDQCTPIVVQDFIITQTASLLLLSR